ncbi:MAG: hydroxymyristoyl-ACP dehydratase [Burkholderiaceae bacterium]
MTLAPEKIEDLIPHAGRMCLLERVLAWSDDQIHCETTSHGWSDNPLRRSGRLAGIHLIEYGAQAMAVHGALLARTRGETLAGGYLAALRGITLRCAHIHELTGSIRVGARRLAAVDGNLMYSFDVHHGERCLAEGRVTVASLRAPPHKAFQS